MIGLVHGSSLLCRLWRRGLSPSRIAVNDTGPRLGAQGASVWGMSGSWPALDYREWRDTCDTLHAHTQVLGKLAVALAPPEPQLQHAAL
ncbi:MAG TPA: DUF5996 family protein, partial [Solirubrobacteraceae bacterium]|nr:DUF5996 family protein [Solirubrobacteraceae bacterium]